VIIFIAFYVVQWDVGVPIKLLVVVIGSFFPNARNLRVSHSAHQSCAEAIWDKAKLNLRDYRLSSITIRIIKRMMLAQLRLYLPNTTCQLLGFNHI
jgi:hypothetical protein